MTGDIEDGFVKVTGSSRIKKRKFDDTNPEKTDKVPLKNKYAPLQISSTEEMVIDENNVQLNKINNTVKVRSENKTTRIPPIITQNVKVDHKTVIEGFKKLCKSLVHFKYPNETQVNIYTTTKEDYETTIEFLKFKEHQFYTYTPDWEKTKQVILKGIPKVDEQDIEKELKE